MSVVDDLAAVVRAALDKQEQQLREGRYEYGEHHLHVLRNRAILGGWVVSRQSGVSSELNDAIINAAVDYQQELFTRWQRDGAEPKLAEVSSRRALLDEALAWEHHVDPDDDPHYTCPILIWPHIPCTCGRDARVTAVLRHLAAPYTEAS